MFRLSPTCGRTILTLYNSQRQGTKLARNLHGKKFHPLSCYTEGGNIRPRTIQQDSKKKESSFNTISENRFRSKQGNVNHLQLQVFGCNTDVGKTIVSAGLVRAAINFGILPTDVHYIKPIQTGGNDEGFIQKYVSEVNSHTLFEWDTPCSVHLASKIENKNITKEKILEELYDRLHQNYKSSIFEKQRQVLDKKGEENKNIDCVQIVETAGGVLSPGATDASIAQADLYRPLRLPTILIGDGRLGGISTTISALESLYVRGYDVRAIILIEENHNEDGLVLNNSSAIKDYLEKMNLNSKVIVESFPPIPPNKDEPLFDWYISQENSFNRLFSSLVQQEEQRIDKLNNLMPNARKGIWWPFTQHQEFENDNDDFNHVLNTIDSAHGDYYKIYYPTNFSKCDEIDDSHQNLTSSSPFMDSFDACASWWTQGLGHGRGDTALHLAHAAGRYGHTIFPQIAHEPAVDLTNYILHHERGPGYGWAKRVFFTDNGSTGVEVALKMALKTYMLRKSNPSCDGINTSIQPEHLVLSQEGCYHGDTLGVMDTSSPNIFNANQHPWYKPRTLSLPVPSFGYVNGIVTVTLPNPTEIEVYQMENAADNDAGLDEVLNFCGSQSLKGMFESSKMDSVGPDNHVSNELQFKSIFDLFDFKLRDESHLATVYRNYINFKIDQIEKDPSTNKEIACVLLEPIMMGAGGMIMVDPLYQRIIVQECKKRHKVVVYDEVAAGLYRLGCSSASSLLGIQPELDISTVSRSKEGKSIRDEVDYSTSPDVAVYGKSLTGGYVPLSLTITTDEVFKTFEGDSKMDALLHGHSYTAYPMACAVSNHALHIYEKSIDQYKEEIQGRGASMKKESNSNNIPVKVRGPFDLWDTVLVAEISCLDCIEKSINLGTVFVMEIKSGNKGYNSSITQNLVLTLRERGIYVRPLGNVLYIMGSQTTTRETCSYMLEIIKNTLIQEFELSKTNLEKQTTQPFLSDTKKSIDYDRYS